MRASLLSILALSACVDENEVCATYDGSACSEVVGDVASLQEAMAGLQERLDAAEATIASQQAQLVDANGEIAVLQQDLSGANDEIADLEVRLDTVESDYLVGADVADAVRLIEVDTDLEAADPDEIEAQLAWLDGRRIGRDATVTVVLTSDAYTFTEPLRLAHPDGGRLQIRPDVGVSPVLTFPSTDGIVVEDGTDIGYLGGIALVGGTSYSGLSVMESSSVVVGDLDVQGWSVGIMVAQNAALSLEEGAAITLADCYYGAYVAFSAYADLTGASAAACSIGFRADGGYLVANGASSANASSTGFYASDLGVIQADGAASDSDGTGFYAKLGGYIYAPNSVAADSTDSAGYYANAGALLYASYGSATGNAESGFLAEAASAIFATHGTATGNGDHGFYSGEHSAIYAPYSYSLGNSIYQYVTYYNGFIYAHPTASGSDTSDIWEGGHDFTDLMIF